MSLADRIEYATRIAAALTGHHGTTEARVWDRGEEVRVYVRYARKDYGYLSVQSDGSVDYAECERKGTWRPLVADVAVP